MNLLEPARWARLAPKAIVNPNQPKLTQNEFSAKCKLTIPRSKLIPIPSETIQTDLEHPSTFPDTISELHERKNSDSRDRDF